MKKRILSILLTLCMVLTLVPTTAFAEGELGGASEDSATDVSDKVVFNKQDTYPYTGSPVDFNPTCDDIKEWSFEYYDSNDAVLYEAPSALGKYTVIIIGFGADCSARIEHTYSIVSVAKEEIQYTAEDYTGVYDKQPHSITLNVSTSDVTIMYSTSADGEYVAEKPTFTDAGTYTVYYLIEKENCDPVSGSATVTITQCTPQLYFTQASVVLQNDQDKCQLEWVYTGDGILRFGSSDDHAIWVDDNGVVYRKRSNCGTSIYCKASETKNCKSVTAMCNVEHGISYIYYDPMNHKPIIENLDITTKEKLEEKVEVLTSELLDLEKPPVLYIDAKLIDPSDPLKKKELHNVRVNFTVPYEEILEEASLAQLEVPLSACDFTVLHQRIDDEIEEVPFLRRADGLKICDTLLSPFAIVAYPKKYYNLYYDVNGGTDTPMIQRVPIDSESYSVTLSSEKPSRSGYKFEGWSLSSSGDVQYMPGDTITLDRDIVLYAVWSEKTYTVILNTNGGNTIPDKNVIWTDKVLDGITAPTKNGWEFTGWKCGDTSVTEDTTYGDLAVNDTTSSITLVAQWEYITAPTGGSGYRPTRPASPSEPQPSIGGSEKSWSEVAADLAKLTTGSEVTIELNGNTTVPVEVIKAIAENKLKVTFVVDSIRSWKTDGADITTPAAADLSILATSKLKTDGLRGIYGYQFSMNDANIPTGIEIAFTPTAYSQFKKDGNITAKHPYNWSSRTIDNMLERPEYVGCTVNFKTQRKSYKCKKMVKNTRDKWVVFEDTHPAIISRHDFDLVQEIRKHKNRSQKHSEVNPFSGMVYCADCGKLMYLCRSKSHTAEQEHLKCSSYANNQEVCSAHFVRTAVLRKIVLAELSGIMIVVKEHEQEFIKMALDNSTQQQSAELKSARKQLSQAERRIAEIDRLFVKLYEDNVSGKVSDERYTAISKTYEDEQKQLKAKVPELTEFIAAREQKTADTAKFVEIVHKYSEVTELTPTIMHEFVEKIVVHAPDKSGGHRTQHIDIYWRFNVAVSTTTANRLDYQPKRRKAV